MRNREQQKIKDNSRKNKTIPKKVDKSKKKKLKKWLPNLTTKTLMVYNVYNGL